MASMVAVPWATLRQSHTRAARQRLAVISARFGAQVADGKRSLPFVNHRDLPFGNGFTGLSKRLKGEETMRAAFIACCLLPALVGGCAADLRTRPHVVIEAPSAGDAAG
ncbi:MAG: hypothetical protein M3R41_05515, partial [Pseudomonadota bacterium]|nr:hypothetical protein [Pseudomonadota bacterium]